MHFLKPLIKNTCNTTKKLIVAALCQKKLPNPPLPHVLYVLNASKTIQEHTKHICALQEKPEPT